MINAEINLFCYPFSFIYKGFTMVPFPMEHNCYLIDKNAFNYNQLGWNEFQGPISESCFMLKHIAYQKYLRYSSLTSQTFTQNECALAGSLLNNAYQKYLRYSSLTSQTFTQNECALAGSLLNNAYQKYLLSKFSWLPSKVPYQLYAFCLVVCLILLSENNCLAEFSA